MRRVDSKPTIANNYYDAWTDGYNPLHPVHPLEYVVKTCVKNAADRAQSAASSM